MDMKLFTTCFLFVSFCTVLCQSQAVAANVTTEASSTTDAGSTTHGDVNVATSTTVSGGNVTQTSTMKGSTAQSGTTEKNGSAIVSALPLLFNLVPMVLLYFARF